MTDPFVKALTTAIDADQDDRFVTALDLAMAAQRPVDELVATVAEGAEEDRIERERQARLADLESK